MNDQIATPFLLPYSTILRHLKGRERVPQLIGSKPVKAGELSIWVHEGMLTIAIGSMLLESTPIVPLTLSSSLVRDIMMEQSRHDNWQALLALTSVHHCAVWMLNWKRTGHYLEAATPSGHRLMIMTVRDAVREQLIEASRVHPNTLLLMCPTIQDNTSPHGVASTELLGNSARLVSRAYLRDLAAMRTALSWSAESFDSKVRVGATIVNSKGRVAGIGYNGRAPGESGGNSREHADQGMSGYVHAEANALMHSNLSEQGNTLYVTHEPCATCARMILTAQTISRVVYMHSYREKDRQDRNLPSGAQLLARSGVTVEVMNPSHVLLSARELTPR